MKKRPSKSPKLSWFKRNIKGATTFMLGLILLYLSFVVGIPFGRWLYWHSGLVEFLVFFSLSMALVGCGEELLFRHYLMDRLMIRKFKWKPISAALASSFIFGMAHLGNGVGLSALPQACGATIGGLCFAYTYRKYGLKWAVALHATYDFLIILWFITSR